MANLEHLAELNKGVRSWNQWRKENPHIIPDLRKANLSLADMRRADFSSADLSFAKFSAAKLSGAEFSNTYLISVNFSKADLSSADLSKTDLRFANFSNSNLDKASLCGANLCEAYLRKAFLSKADLSNAILNAANLSFTNLTKASLSKANLNLANLEAANLQDADLYEAQVLGTNFIGANLTGACLQYWNISSKTTLGGVHCDYVYLKKSCSSKFRDRYPKNRTFQSGEFIELFQQTSKTPEIFFSNGIAEFCLFFQELQQNYTDKVFAIKEIEPISESSFVVRLEVLPKINEEATKKFYEEQRHLAKTTYRLAQENTQIPCQHHTQIIELYKQNNSDMIEIIKLLASRSINVEATAMSNSEKFINNLQGANINSFANQISDRACQNANQYNYNPETKSLASVAIEIQALLDRLSQIYPTDTMAAKVTLATEAIQYIDNNPSFAQRIIRALQSGSISALEQFLSHPAASFFISALEDWQKTREQ